MNIVFHHFENPPERDEEERGKRKDEHTGAKAFRLSVFYSPDRFLTKSNS